LYSFLEKKNENLVFYLKKNYTVDADASSSGILGINGVTITCSTELPMVPRSLLEYSSKEKT
jgi:hypothetical protein